MESITVKGELLFELRSKQEWVNKVPGILPDKIKPYEQWVWVDINGNIYIRGADFQASERLCTFPCKVYRLQSVYDRESVIISNSHEQSEAIEKFKVEFFKALKIPQIVSWLSMKLE